MKCKFKLIQNWYARTIYREVGDMFEKEKGGGGVEEVR